MEQFENAGGTILLPETTALSRIYTELRIASAGNGFGPTPLSWSEVYAYCRLTRTKLDRWMLGLLRQVDLIYLRHAAERREAEMQTLKKNDRQPD